MQQYAAFDNLDDEFGSMQQPDGFAALADEAFEGGGMMQQQAGFNGSTQNPAGAAGTWDVDFDWETGGQGLQQQGMGMGGMSMGLNGGNMNINGGDWGGGAEEGDGTWAGGDDDMMGQMGSQMSNQMGGDLAQGGMMGQMGGGGFGPGGMGPGVGGGFGPGGMRGPGPMGPGGMAPGNAAGANPNACFNCGASDHMARNCPHPKDFATQCHNCGETGHRAKDCPNAPSQPPPPPMQRPGPGWGPSAGKRQTYRRHRAGWGVSQGVLLQQACLLFCLKSSSTQCQQLANSTAAVSVASSAMLSRCVVVLVFAVDALIV